MEVDQQAGLGRVLQDRDVVGDHGYAIAREEIDLHALDAHVANARELLAALLAGKQCALRRILGLVPCAGRVVPDQQANILAARVGAQFAHPVVADLAVPVCVDQGVVPLHVGSVVDELLLHVVDGGVVLEQGPAPGGVAGRCGRSHRATRPAGATRGRSRPCLLPTRPARCRRCGTGPGIPSRP